MDDEEEIEEELEIEDIELDEDTEIEIIEDEEDFEEDTPFMIVENMPAFGPCLGMRGDERHQCTQMEIIKYVSSNTKYPPIAKDAGIQGTVFVYFVVGKNGKVRDVKVLVRSTRVWTKKPYAWWRACHPSSRANSAESRCRFSTPSR